MNMSHQGLTGRSTVIGTIRDIEKKREIVQEGVKRGRIEWQKTERRNLTSGLTIIYSKQSWV